jgi:hypothetical protein
MIEVTDIYVNVYSTDRIELTWSIKDTREDVHDYYIDIYRSNSEGGPWTLLVQNIEDRYRFVDGEVDLRDKWRVFYYKLIIKNKSTGATQEYEPVSAQFKGDLIAIEVQRREEMYFEKFVGKKVLFYKRRTFGQRCNCYDPILQNNLRDRCLNCFNTGYTRGYYDPLPLYMQIDPVGRSTSMSQGGEMQTENSTARTIGIPYISPRDLIVESTNKRWRVVTSVPTEKRREVVHQELQLCGLTPGDIAFEVPVPWSAFSTEDDQYFYKRPMTI